MKAGIVLVCLLAFPALAGAQDRIIGLLSLPEVFGGGACDRFTPEEVTLHAGPDAGSIVGSIRVDRYWTFHAVGGCEGLTVNVHTTDAQDGGELPTREVTYEAPAAIVFERRGSWFRVRLPSGTAWLHASERDEYVPLEQLLTNGPTYLTDATDRRLTNGPGAPRRGEGSVAPGRHVRVTESRDVGGQLWIRVEVLSHSVCESPQEPTVTARGWLRAHAPSGEPSVWFYSRGC